MTSPNAFLLITSVAQPTVNRNTLVIFGQAYSKEECRYVMEINERGANGRLLTIITSRVEKDIFIGVKIIITNIGNKLNITGYFGNEKFEEWHLSGDNYVSIKLFIFLDEIALDTREFDAVFFDRKSKSSSRPNIRIYSPHISRYDAVGNHCVAMGKRLEENGYSVQLYCHQMLTARSRSISHIGELELDINDNDILIVHYSTFDPWLERILKFNNYKIVMFHNITPAFYFDQWSTEMYKTLTHSERQLQSIESFDKHFAASQFSADFLNQHFLVKRNISILLPFDARSKRDVRFKKKKPEGNIEFLWVGRIVPNKRLDKVLHIFHRIAKAVPNVHLKIIGSRSLSRYCESIDLLIDTLHLKDKICMMENISDVEYESAFASADVLIHASEHEGFGVPVYEAMMSGVIVFGVAGPSIKEMFNINSLLFEARELDDNFDDHIYNLIDTLNNPKIRVKLLNDQRNSAIAMRDDFPLLLSILQRSSEQ